MIVSSISFLKFQLQSAISFATELILLGVRGFFSQLKSFVLEKFFNMWVKIKERLKCYTLASFEIRELLDGLFCQEFYLVYASAQKFVQTK